MTTDTAMENPLAFRLRNLLEYEKDCNARLLKMLASVPAENRDDQRFQKAIDKFAHAVVCRKLWMYRFGDTDLPPSTCFPAGIRLDQLPEMMDPIYEKWDRFMSELTDEKLAEMFEYHSSEGDHYKNRIEDIVLQLHGHMLYHRGQVVTLIAMCGGEVEDTDYVYWTRQLLARA